LALLTAFVTIRLRRLPVGRAWEALREDEIACRSLGINTTSTKLTAFSIGAGFGGFAFGVLAAPSRRMHPRHAALALEMRHGPRGRDATPVEPAVGLDDHRLVGGEGLRLAPPEEGLAVPLELDFDQLAAHA